MDCMTPPDVGLVLAGGHGRVRRPRASGGRCRRRRGGGDMLLWALGKPAAHRHNPFVRLAVHSLTLDACGRRLSLLQSPLSMNTPGVTGAVVLAKFLEHAADSHLLLLRGTRVVELGAGCGVVGCVAALLGANVVLTDLPDRLKLLRKNVELNVGDAHVRGSARVTKLVWGDDPDHELLEPPPEFSEDNNCDNVNFEFKTSDCWHMMIIL